ncbi:Abi family protein [Asticcacaulis sp. W401b]|uniref:Abi family protein n=1 Tax=Asticcacaulis sp. W401b TaxID=3388666 RepID=UPI003970F221
MKPPFAKPALSHADQLARLIAHGMIVPDQAAALHALQHISYYRLSAYWLPFEHPKGATGPRFLPGTSLDTVLALYEFDRKLRMLVTDAIDRIEVAVRGSWAHVLALSGGPHAYLSPVLYQNSEDYLDNLSNLIKEVRRSKDVFIKHYYAKYAEPAMPPVWMASEVMSFGSLSRWYKLLAQPSDRQAIANPFGLDERVMVPFVHHLVVVRNTCAHHGRLWNRHFQIRPALPRRPSDLATSLEPGSPAQLYNTLCIIAFVLQKVDLASTFAADLKALIAQHPTGDVAAMGFPANWLGRALWL